MAIETGDKGAETVGTSTTAIVTIGSECRQVRLYNAGSERVRLAFGEDATSSHPADLGPGDVLRYTGKAAYDMSNSTINGICDANSADVEYAWEKRK